MDSGTPPLSCDSPEDCKVQGSDGVCRQDLCRSDVKCGDDAECGLGESCVSGLCRFTGCVGDSDCAVGKCRTDVFACTECGVNADCPATSPVCTEAGRCVSCQSDTDCRYPGPAYCEVSSGACLHCLEDAQCPNGLKCGKGGVCTGAPKNAICNPPGIQCDLGLMCVNVGNDSLCLEACNLYVPECVGGEICLKLTFQDSASLVFDQGAPLGVCYPPFQGARGYGETCNDNCQPNLACIPDSPVQSSCKAYCDPKNPFCAPGEICHTFPGDYWGHEYGLCYPNNGFADPCDGEGDCPAALTCIPRDDPSTSSRLSNACAFATGTTPGLGACSMDSECRSGACEADPVLGSSAPYFCFAACQDDADCSVAGRTGVCDADFLFTSQYVLAPGEEVRGCRPGCSAPSDCNVYGAGFTCRAQVDTKAAEFDETCAEFTGVKLLGESCTSDGECRDGYCLRRDGRGVFRQGVCTHPCAAGGDCVPPPLTDGGTAGVATACGDGATLINNGPDGQLNTADDRRAIAPLCTGGACTRNTECSGPFTECTVDVVPTAPNSQLQTVCRAPSQFGSLIAGDPCSNDSQCRSGVCAEIGTGPQRTCLQPCDTAASDCVGGTTCTANGVRVRRADGTYQLLDACVP